jgi:hypothetical protein
LVGQRVSWVRSDQPIENTSCCKPDHRRSGPRPHVRLRPRPSGPRSAFWDGQLADFPFVQGDDRDAVKVQALVDVGDALLIADGRSSASLKTRVVFPAAASARASVCRVGSGWRSKQPDPFRPAFRPARERGRPARRRDGRAGGGSGPWRPRLGGAVLSQRELTTHFDRAKRARASIIELKQGLPWYFAR